MTPYKVFAMSCLLGSGCAQVCLAQDRPSVVRIEHSNDGYVLLRDGKQFFIKGAGGAQERLDTVEAAGGNSIREWSPDETTLDRARHLGLTVLVGLPLGIPRHGFDYGNAELVQKQLADILQTVRHLKDNPAVLMWALGNELELNASQGQRIAAWKAVEEAARAVKAEDPNHPVIAVLAGPGKDKLRELDQYCPSLDAVGINTYGGIMNLPEAIKAQEFKRPYIVTEFGPRGHWEVEKTAWGMPIEDTSTQKEEFIVQGYEHSIAKEGQCLGSYVFLWGEKQEKTHTWYGLFLPDGTRLGGVDAMQYLWTGKWPAHRSPIIQQTISAKTEKATDKDAPGVFQAGATIRCTIVARDPEEGDPLRIKWDIRRDVSNNPSSGGDREAPSPPIAGAVIRESDQTAIIRVPSAPGDYRIFVYVYNMHGGAATANLPIEAK
jgi:Glycosyl hydrolases family 2, TIM barrel domain